MKNILKSLVCGALMCTILVGLTSNAYALKKIGDIGGVFGEPIQHYLLDTPTECNECGTDYIDYETYTFSHGMNGGNWNQLCITTNKNLVNGNTYIKNNNPYHVIVTIKYVQNYSNIEIYKVLLHPGQEINYIPSNELHNLDKIVDEDRKYVGNINFRPACLNHGGVNTSINIEE